MNVLQAIDGASGKSCKHLADCLSYGGMVINYGFLDGKPFMITPTHTIVRQISLTRLWLFDRLSKQSKVEIKNIYNDMSGLFVSGVLHSPVEATYFLDQVEKALTHAKQGVSDS